MLLCFVEALLLQPVQLQCQTEFAKLIPRDQSWSRSQLWGGLGRHIPSHCSVAELSLRVAWPRSLAAEWIAGTRGKGRWTEFGLWVQTSFSLKPTSLLPKPCSEKPCEDKVNGKLDSHCDCRCFCSQNPESLLPRQVLFPTRIPISETSALREPAVGASRDQRGWGDSQRGDVCGGPWRMGRRDPGRKERGQHPWEREQLEQRHRFRTHPETAMHAKRRTQFQPSSSAPSF